MTVSWIVKLNTLKHMVESGDLPEAQRKKVCKMARKAVKWQREKADFFKEQAEATAKEVAELEEIAKILQDIADKGRA